MADTIQAAPPEADTRALGAYAKALGERLGETEIVPRQTIWRIVQAYGIEACEALALESEDIWTGRGMQTMAGDRERTLGGVFFALAKSRATEAQRRILYPDWLLAEWRRAKQGQSAPAPRIIPALSDVAADAQREKGAGTVSSVSLKVIGHPATIQQRGSVFFFVLTSERVPDLPKGMPAFAPTCFLVIIPEKQWRKVADTLHSDPESRLMVEGFPTVADGFTGIAVAATAATILPPPGKKEPRPAAPPRPYDPRTELKGASLNEGEAKAS